MRVVVPHTQTGLHDRTRQSVQDLAPDAEFILLPLGDDDAYWRLLAALWASGDDFAIVEQDIVPHEDVFDEFRACSEPWCTFGYEYFVGGDYHGSGCVRFRARLTGNEPDLMLAVAQYANDKHPARHWCSLDAFTQHELYRRGYEAHHHHPSVGHLDPTVSHGCIG